MKTLFNFILLCLITGCITSNAQNMTFTDLTLRDDLYVTDDMTVVGISTMGPTQSTGLFSLTATSPLLLGQNGSTTTVNFQNTTPGSIKYTTGFDFQFNRPVIFDMGISGGIAMDFVDFSGDASRGFSLLVGDGTDADWSLVEMTENATVHTIWWDFSDLQWTFQRGIETPNFEVTDNTGIDFNIGSDNDIDLLSPAVTETPIFQWADTETAFRVQKAGLVVGSGDNGDLTEVIDTVVVTHQFETHLESGSANEGGIQIMSHTTGNANGHALNFTRSLGSHGAQTIVLDNSQLGQIKFAGYDGTDYHSGVEILARADGTPASNDVPGELVFSTWNGGTQTERFNLLAGGDLLIDSDLTLTSDTYSTLTMHYGDIGKGFYMRDSGSSRWSNFIGSGGMQTYHYDTSGDIGMSSGISASGAGYVQLDNNAHTATILLSGEFGLNLTNATNIYGDEGNTTLGAAATTIAVTGSTWIITGDAGGNTLGTITGLADGSHLDLLFVDALVTITDDETQTTDTVDLQEAFTSADDTILSLVRLNGSWYERSRSPVPSSGGGGAAQIISHFNTRTVGHNNPTSMIDIDSDGANSGCLLTVTTHYANGANSASQVEQSIINWNTGETPVRVETIAATDALASGAAPNILYTLSTDKVAVRATHSDGGNRTMEMSVVLQSFDPANEFTLSDS